MLSSINSLYSLQPRSTTAPVLATKIVSRYDQRTPGRKNHPCLRITVFNGRFYFIFSISILLSNNQRIPRTSSRIHSSAMPILLFNSSVGGFWKKNKKKTFFFRGILGSLENWGVTIYPLPVHTHNLLHYQHPLWYFLLTSDEPSLTDHHP